MAQQSINSTSFKIIKFISRTIIALSVTTFALIMLQLTAYVNELPETIRNLVILLPINNVDFLFASIAAGVISYFAFRVYESFQLDKLWQPWEYPNYDQRVEKSLSWSPIKKSGYQTKLHQLVEPTSSQVQLKLRKSVIIEIIVSQILFLGTFSLILIVYELIEGLVLVAVFALLVSRNTLRVLKYAGTPRNFDKLTGYYWQGDESLTQIEQIKQTKDATLLSDIIGIQIIEEEVGMGESRTTSYELNLILKSNHRINITDHANKKAIISNANGLSNFLNVPVYIR